MMRPIALVALAFAIPAPASPRSAPAAAAVEGPTAEAILDSAIAAHGGENWARVKTLYLAGTATFYGETGAAPRSIVDDYRMWRVFDTQRKTAHAAEGKVRIIAKIKGHTLFTVGFDGETSWNERGVIPEAEAKAYWASNFGFGIIRRARDPGFKAERVPDDSTGGHPLYVVRLTDPGGGVTIFGIDRESYAIRRMGFATPRGWHERTYDDFTQLKPSRWLQARLVTLYYNGVKQNEVRWKDVKVDQPIDDAVFRLVVQRR